MEKRMIKKNTTIRNLLERYYSQKLDNNLISERTYAIYQNIIDILDDNLGELTIQEIQVQDIENLCNNIRKYSNETITKIWNSLRLAFKIAYNRHIIPYNIMLDETLLKPNSSSISSRVEALNQKEQSNLIRALKRDLKISPHYTQYIYACLLCLYTGSRIGEILGLCKDAIDLENNTLTIKRTLTTDTIGRIYLSNHTKTYKIGKNNDTGKRTFFMNSKVRTILKKLFELSKNETTPDAILFWNHRKNSYLSSNDINRYLQRINQKYKIIPGRLHSHILRHTFITRCVEAGMNLKVIQYLVGHTKSSTLTLDIYTSVSPEFIKNEFQKLEF